MSEPGDTGAAGPQPEPGATQPGPQFAIHKIYVKDISFETPHSPEIFRAEWRPNVDLQISSEQNQIAAGTYEVVLRITATVTIDEKTAFLVEVHQGGIFAIGGIDNPDLLKQVLGSYCPNVLFPYARETVSDLVTRGGFPQFVLAPVNFDAAYAKHRKDTEGEGQQPSAPLN